jgi:hypothetical protein
MSGPQGGRGADLLAEFAAFLEFREQQQREASGADVDVPLFEKLTDGTERSATLPMAQARRLLESWGWLGPEGEGDGGSEGTPDASGAPRRFFEQLTGGKQASGPAPAGGKRAPRQAAG